jgi:hypothetical protein
MLWELLEVLGLGLLAVVGVVLMLGLVSLVFYGLLSL